MGAHGAQSSNQLKDLPAMEVKIASAREAWGYDPALPFHQQYGMKGYDAWSHNHSSSHVYVA